MSPLLPVHASRKQGKIKSVLALRVTFILSQFTNTFLKKTFKINDFRFISAIGTKFDPGQSEDEVS